jgi:hypothetical protein
VRGWLQQRRAAGSTWCAPDPSRGPHRRLRLRPPCRGRGGAPPPRVGRACRGTGASFPDHPRARIKSPLEPRGAPAGAEGRATAAGGWAAVVWRKKGGEGSAAGVGRACPVASAP